MRKNYKILMASLLLGFLNKGHASESFSGLPTLFERSASVLFSNSPEQVFNQLQDRDLETQELIINTLFERYLQEEVSSESFYSFIQEAAFRGALPTVDDVWQTKKTDLSLSETAEVDDFMRDAFNILINEKCDQPLMFSKTTEAKEQLRILALRAILHNQENSHVIQKIKAAKELVKLSSISSQEISMISSIATDPTSDINIRSQAAEILEGLDQDQAIAAYFSITERLSYYNPKTYIIKISAALIRLGKIQEAISLLSPYVDKSDSFNEALEIANLLKDVDLDKARSTYSSFINNPGSTSTNIYRLREDKILAIEALLELGQTPSEEHIFLIMKDPIKAGKILKRIDREKSIMAYRSILSEEWRGISGYDTIDALQGLGELGKQQDAIAVLLYIVSPTNERRDIKNAWQRLFPQSTESFFNSRVICSQVSIRDVYEPANSRIKAARALAKLGEKQKAISVLESIILEKSIHTAPIESQFEAAKALEEIDPTRAISAYSNIVACRSRSGGLISKSELEGILIKSALSLKELNATQQAITLLSSYVDQSDLDQRLRIAKILEGINPNAAIREYSSIFRDVNNLNPYRSSYSSGYTNRIIYATQKSLFKLNRDQVDAFAIHSQVDAIYSAARDGKMTIEDRFGAAEILIELNHHEKAFDIIFPIIGKNYKKDSLEAVRMVLTLKREGIYSEYQSQDMIRNLTYILNKKDRGSTESYDNHHGERNQAANFLIELGASETLLSSIIEDKVLKPITRIKAAKALKTTKEIKKAIPIIVSIFKNVATSNQDKLIAAEFLESVDPKEAIKAYHSIKTSDHNIQYLIDQALKRLAS